MPRVCSHVDALARGSADRGHNGRDDFATSGSGKLWRRRRSWDNQEEVKDEITGAAIGTKAIRLRDFDGSQCGWDPAGPCSQECNAFCELWSVGILNEAEKITTEAKDDNFDLTMAKEVDVGRVVQHFDSVLHWRGFDDCEERCNI